MPAVPLKLSPKTPANFRDLIDEIQRAQLSEVHVMLLLGSHALRTHGTACPLAIAQILLSLVRGLSTVTYRKTEGNLQQTFRAILNEHYPWGAEPAGAIAPGPAIHALYSLYRNPLSHVVTIAPTETAGELRGALRRQTIGVRRQQAAGAVDWTEEALVDLEKSSSRPSVLRPTMAQEARWKYLVWLTVEGFYWGMRRLIESLTFSVVRMEAARRFFGEHERPPRI
jgi:hypothetical protein